MANSFRQIVRKMTELAPPVVSSEVNPVIVTQTVLRAVQDERRIGSTLTTAFGPELKAHAVDTAKGWLKASIDGAYPYAPRVAKLPTRPVAIGLHAAEATNPAHVMAEDGESTGAIPAVEVPKTALRTVDEDRAFAAAESVLDPAPGEKAQFEDKELVVAYTALEMLATQTKDPVEGKVATAAAETVLAARPLSRTERWLSRFIVRNAERHRTRVAVAGHVLRIV